MAELVDALVSEASILTDVLVRVQSRALIRKKAFAGARAFFLGCVEKEMAGFRWLASRPVAGAGLALAVVVARVS